MLRIAKGVVKKVNCAPFYQWVEKMRWQDDGIEEVKDEASVDMRAEYTNLSDREEAKRVIERRVDVLKEVKVNLTLEEYRSLVEMIRAKQAE